MAAYAGTEYRIQGKDQAGRLIQGFITAASFFEARKRARTLAESRKATVLSVRKRKAYKYCVRRGEKVLVGFQTAFSRAEVVAALLRLGFEVEYVRRFFDFRTKAASNEIASFIMTGARLLEQKFLLNEVLETMSNNVRDKNLKAALREILYDLKNGMDSREAFLKQSKVFGHHVALMLG
ncbi:MAG: hypothetical protein ACRDGA_02305, partial [Bacteroidota bacterium]